LICVGNIYQFIDKPTTKAVLSNQTEIELDYAFYKNEVIAEGVAEVIIFKMKKTLPFLAKIEKLRW
jgi:hypothetical protein